MTKTRKPIHTVLCVLLVVAAGRGQGHRRVVPNGAKFPNPAGTSSTYSTTGAIDLSGAFFQSLGTNGRSCGTCHQPSDSMSVSAASVQRRFDATAGLDPIFRTVDGSNCNHDIDISTVAGRRTAYSLMRTRGLIRVAIQVPANADFDVVSVENPYSCNETDTISQYRRPLPAANLRFLSAVMFDGRESSPLTGTTKILPTNYPDSLRSNLLHQAMDATTGHAQGDGARPTPDEQKQIVDFEMGLFTAQATGHSTGNLDAQGATGGPKPSPGSLSSSASTPRSLLSRIQPVIRLTPRSSVSSTLGPHCPTTIPVPPSRAARLCSIPRLSTSPEWLA